MAFNDDDPGYIRYFDTGSSQYRVACKWGAGAGYARRTSNGSWLEYNLIQPNPSTSGIALLWADPAIAEIPSTGKLFVSFIASPNALFDASTNVSGAQCNVDGAPVNCCPNGAPGIRNGGGGTWPTGMQNYLAGACIARGTVGGTVSLTSWSADCVQEGATDFFDGGTLAASASYVYAAYWNYDQDRIAVFRATSTGAWTHLATPFAGKSMQGHPLLLSKVGGVFLLGRDSLKKIWLSSFANSGSTWTTPVQVASGTENLFETTLKDGTKIRQRGFAAGSSSRGPNPPDIDFFYLKRAPGGVRTQIQGVRCTTSTPITCTLQTSWIKGDDFTDVFLPAVDAAFKPTTRYPNPSRRVSFWTNAGIASGNVRMQLWDYEAGLISYPTGHYQQTCPDLRDYWGDYDVMFSVGDGTTSGKWVRPITDSTGALCVRNEFEASPQDISVFEVPVP